MPARSRNDSQLEDGPNRTGPTRTPPRHTTRHSYSLLLCAAILATAIVGANVVLADELTVTSSLSRDAVAIDDAMGELRIDVRERGYYPLREVGRPDLPFRIVNVLLPQGHEVERVDVTCTDRCTLRDNARVRLGRPLVATDGTRAGAANDFELSGNDTTFPPVMARHLGTGSLHGYTIASFAVYPLQYEDGKVVLNGTVELRVYTRESHRRATTVAMERPRESLNAKARRRVSSLVSNPEMLDRYAFHAVRSGATDGGFQPTEAPSLEGSPVEYLIVTSEALSSEYQRLADWKTAKGVPAVVRTTEWIRANCRNGVDLAETIRFFLRDAYEKWGVQWVLLGGDTDVIPTRYAYSAYLGDVNYVPTDLYFACLDGSWNESHDHIWGQAGVDDVDLYAELFVGRLPTSTVAEAGVQIDKIVAYESAIERDYSDEVLLLAEVLFPPNWSEGEPIVLNGAQLSESLYVKTLADEPIEITRAYESYQLYGGSVPLSKQATIDSMNAGIGIVNHVGHGYRFNISCGDASLLNTDADLLANGSRLFVMFMVDCYVSAFDYACLAEHFMKNPNGGAVATIGSSHIEFPVIDAYYMNDYYDLLFDQGVTRIGEAFAGSRLSQTPWAELGDNVDRWTHYILTLLADPELDVWTGPVDTAVVAHVTNVGLGSNSILVEVSAGGSPADSATVCLYKAGEDYRVGTTDAAGEVQIVFTAESPGSVGVVVTGHNVARHESYITVVPSSSAYVHFAGVDIDDDSTGGSFGNGDGVIDAGETVDLLLSLVNTGGSPSGVVSVEIGCDSALVTVVDSVALVGIVEPDSIRTAQELVRVAFDTAIPDGADVVFDLAITDDASGSWADQIVETVRAPGLELVSLRIDDGPPLGNGDGVIEPDEEFRLYYGVKNYGSGTAGGLAAQLEDVDEAFAFFDSTDSYPDVLPFTGEENAAGFRIAEADTTVEHRLALEIVDLFGRVYLDTIELRPPDPPSSLFFDASHGVDRIEVAWAPSASPDVSRYQVYRSTSAGGPYSLATVDPVEHSAFVDAGLAPSTKYYYVVTSVDSSGNESAYSPEYSASTNPPQAAGWPIEMKGSSPSSPAIGDIDGDGDVEIVVGNTYVYAWHHDGLELRDGDQDPQTWGILNTEGDVFAAAVALARLDGTPGLDIIAADLYTNSVYCMNYMGDLLPGWPQAGEDEFRAAPVAGDLDGDGVFEVVAVDVRGVIYAWHSNGTEVIDGDLDPMTTGVFFRCPETIAHYQTPALCDLDGDGSDEVVLGTRTGEVFALNGDGSDVPGWPFTLAGEAVGSVSVGDVDDDGALEIVCHTRSGQLYLLNHDGTVASGWPRMISINEPYFAPSPALADFDADGKLEVVVVGYVSSATELYVVKANGQFYTGWPVQFNAFVATECSPVVADIDDDGSPDIVIGDESRYIYAFDIGGNMLDGFPIATGDAVRATPYLGDVDLDGDIDMVHSGWDKNLYIWDLTGAYGAEETPWPTFRANVHRNGQIGFDVPTGVGGYGERPRSVPVRVPKLAQNYPNPFGTSTTIVFHVTDGSPKRVSLRIYDVTGALVTSLVDDELAPGRYTAHWGGKDNRGNRVGTGLYFYQLREPGFTLTKKLVLIR